MVGVAAEVALAVACAAPPCSVETTTSSGPSTRHGKKNARSFAAAVAEGDAN